VVLHGTLVEANLGEQRVDAALAAARSEHRVAAAGEPLDRLAPAEALRPGWEQLERRALLAGEVEAVGHALAHRDRERVGRVQHAVERAVGAAAGQRRSGGRGRLAEL